MQKKKFPVQTTSLTDNHLSGTPRSVYCLYDSHLHPPGSSSFTPSRDLFRTSQDRRGQGRIWLSRGRRLFCILCLSGHVPVRERGSPKGEDYLSFVHVALQKPLDIKKNKPAQKKGDKKRQDEENEEDEEDEFGNSNYNSNANRNSSNSFNNRGLRQNR